MAKEDMWERGSLETTLNPSRKEVGTGELATLTTLRSKKGFKSGRFLGLLAFLCILIGHQQQPSIFVSGAPDLDQLREFYERYNGGGNGRNFTYDQLRQWFEAQVPEYLRFEVYPRLFPFCLTSSQIKDERRVMKGSHITHFARIFTDLERVNEPFYNFNFSHHSTEGDKSWVEYVTLTRINTPELDMVNLRQWVHITVKLQFPVEGLYMQSIVGPMGLPFGQYFLEFPCQDDPESFNMDIIGETTDCSHRPRTAIQHPSAYVGYDPSGTRNEFHMNFFYTDISCMETPYLQFLLLVVKSFKGYNDTVGPRVNHDYRPFMSPIFLNQDFDSKSGAAFPYYPEWKDSMFCFLDNNTFYPKYTQKYGSRFPSQKVGSDPVFDPLSWKVSNIAYRVLPNELYDACLTGRLHMSGKQDLRDDERLECPPGPFRCDTSFQAGSSRDNISAARQQLVENEEKLKDCHPCGAPACTAIGYPELLCDYKENIISRDKNATEQLLRIEDLIPAKLHGIQAMFAFLVLMPIANFLSRHYKEMSDNFLCGNGPWIFIHIIAHILSLLFMWISIGPVIPKLFEYRATIHRCRSLYNGTYPDTSEGNLQYVRAVRDCINEKHALSSWHGIPALIAFIFQHFLVAFGFWRATHIKMRSIQIALHSHFGYGCWLLGGIASLIAAGAKGCSDVLIICILLFITPFVAHTAGVAVDCITDKKVGIKPQRKQWPILETVKLEGPGPMTKCKWILFGGFTSLMLLYWILALASYYKVAAEADSALEGKDADAANVSISGIFGGCAL